MKISDYEKVQQLVANNIFLLDGDNGTKTILASELAKSLIGLLSSQDFISGVTLSELTQINTLSSGDKLLIGTSAGNKAIGVSDALFAVLDAFAPAELRRTTFRGKNLGTAVTAEQKANIKNRSFKGLFLGDYWSIGGFNWRIVDINYWMNCGDTSFTTPHLVIMPDTALYHDQMNNTKITTGGYVGSKMYTTNLSQAKTLATSAFGNMILTHREYLTDAVTEGRPSAVAWFDSTLELPNEIMMYGCHVYAPANNGSVIPNKHTVDNSQLALMAAYPRFIKTRQTYWLRDVVSAADFAGVSLTGYANYYYATFSNGVRPVFAVG